MKNSNRSKIRKIFIILILIIVAIGIVYYLFFGDNKLSSINQPVVEEMNTEASSDEKSSSAVAIKAITVAQFDFQDFLNALGTLKGGVEFKLSFEIPGIVDKINYKEGEKYEKGALLLSLKQEDILLRLRRSEARFNRSKTTEEIVHQRVLEHEKLFSIGAIPETTLQKAKLELEVVQYEREEAELQVRAEEVILEKSNIYAPSAGMIGELNVEEGEAVTSNTLLGTHILTEYVKAAFGVIERDVNRIALDQKTFVYVDSYPDKVFEGVVDKIAPSITGTSRTADSEVKIYNAEGLLLPGSFARIKILLFEKKNAIVVPTDAVIDVQGESIVYLVDEETNTVNVRTIEIEYKQNDYTIIKTGLQKGDVVALTSLDKLESGKEVEVLEKQQLQ